MELSVVDAKFSNCADALHSAALTSTGPIIAVLAESAEVASVPSHRRKLTN